ncbi:helix-turn-helix domain-containing protein [Mycobacterium sp. AMU20-3851]|uniref:AraC family transcriptional regulator n=1 Tax=Mycobacterium sp. AMU20-3851 TaxID=3122055 RepID=UPI0037540A62
MQDFSFDSDDLGETEDFLGRTYTKMSLGGAGDPARTQVVRRTLGQVSLDRLSVTFDMSYDASPLGFIVLCEVHSGHIEENFIGEPDDVFAPGDLTLYSPPELPYSGRVCAAEYDLTVFDSALFDRVATTAPHGRAGPVKLEGHRPVSPAAKQRLSSLIRYLRDHVLTDEQARNSPLIVDSAVTHLAAATLQAFPNNAQLEPTAADRRDAEQPVLLRRALAYIDEHAHEDISPRDIADAVFLTPRAVQYMFRRHLDCTPTEYLRTVRLDRAHQDLLASSPVDTAVSTVAKRWGFAHGGRFAAYYRQTYGRSPMATLRN